MRRGRMWRVLGLVLVLVTAVLGVTATGAAADTAVYQKYYVVATPEKLSAVATRFLADAGRATDIFNLNRGRTQPDGGKLTDPATVLHMGWVILLPWDAWGDGVRMGVPPTAAPASHATSGGGRGGGGGRAPASSTPKATGSPTAASTGCRAAVPTGGPVSNWAGTRMAPAKVWSRSRGTGVTVAVLDSGVDAGLSQLAGRVSVGSDLLHGGGAGNTDCVGRGTAIAALIAAQAGPPGRPDQVVGMAPDTLILPMRVVAGTEAPGASVEANAVVAAVSAGATVIALTGAVDLGNAELANAISGAIEHDVVVVARPSASTTGANGVLRVGGIGQDGRLVDAYQDNTVDVVAPGADVLSLASGGVAVSVTGTDYAVAYAAGLAALVRAAYPELHGPQVLHRIEATADHAQGTVADPQLGWGMINPQSAVTQELPGEQASAQPAATTLASSAEVPSSAGAQVPASGTGGQTATALVIVIGGVLLLCGTTLLAPQLRRRIRPGRASLSPAVVDEHRIMRMPDE